MQGKKAKIDEIEHLRGIAFLAVVIQHAIGMFSRTPGFNLSDLIIFSVVFNMVKFAVPLFVFISGMVIFYNYYDRLNYPSYLVKRIREIIIPYLLFTLFYYYYWDYDAANHIAGQFPGIFLTGSGYFHLWFVVMIFQFYLLFPVFRWPFQLVRKFTATYLRAVSVIILLLLIYIGTTYAIFEHIGRLHTDIFGIRGILKYPDRTLFSWYFYFVFGGILAFSIVKWRTVLQKYMFWNIPVFVLGLLWVTYELGAAIQPTAKLPQELPIYLGVSSSFKASMILFTVSSILLWYQVSVVMSQRSNWLTRIFEMFGKYSFGAYLLHAAALDIAHKYIKTVTSLSNSMQMFAAVIVTAAVSLLLTVIISRLPFGNYLIGSTKRKPARITNQPAADTAVPRS